MPTIIALKALVIWVGILVLAIANGVLRESVLSPALGTPIALILSGLLLAALIIVVTYITLPWLGIRELRQLLLVGIGWLVLTLIFEFSFGLWQGKSWSVMFEAYSFKGGNLWLIVLAVTALAPLITAKLRGWV